MTGKIKLIIAASLFGNLAMAQGPAAPPATAPAPEANVTVPQKSSITPAEMVAQSNDYRIKMNEILGKMSGMVEAARKDKDIIRLNCLTNKMVEVKANIAVADQATQSLQEAGARNDDAASLHEFTRITIVNQKVQVLATEAEQCVGEDLSFVGQTKVEVQYTGQEPPNGVTQPGLPAANVDRPPPASAYK